MSNIIINILINGIMALVSSAPPTSTEARLDKTPHNNDTELSKFKVIPVDIKSNFDLDCHLYRVPALKIIRFTEA